LSQTGTKRRLRSDEGRTEPV